MMPLKLRISIGFVVFITACVSSPSVTQLERPVSGVVVTVKNDKLVLPKGTTFSITEEASRFYNDPRLDGEKINLMLRDVIKDTLEAKGFVMEDVGGRYEVAYVVALERSLSDLEISKRFGVNPGLVASSPDPMIYEKGTIVVDVQEESTNMTVWRSALQGFATFDLPDDVRKRRLRKAVERLFGSFPVGY